MPTFSFTNYREAARDSYNCWEAVRDSYNCREAVRNSYNCQEAVGDSYNCREAVPDSSLFKKNIFLKINGKKYLDVTFGPP